MNLFEWIKNKKILERELDNLDRDLMLEKSKSNRLKKDNDFLQEQNEKYIESIKELKKEIRKLKKELKGNNNE
jgi:peptidoglycan hydrolase CwlO-like protein